MSTIKRVKFGAWIPPLHSSWENPTLALHRDIEIVEFLDRLGADEAWFGEHHSHGVEIQGAPDIVIGAAAMKTSTIKLGSAVMSLPYYHPLTIADRFLYLDHLSRGRVMLGCGPGSFVHDAEMMGFDYQQNRTKMAESVDAIHQLLTSDEPVNIKTDWFELVDASVNLVPYSEPCFEMIFASVMSPSGSKLAGRYGGGLLSLSANNPSGFEALRNTWKVVEDEAAAFNQVVDRSQWRIVSFVHLAETEAQAREDLRYGLNEFLAYVNAAFGLPFEIDWDDHDTTIDRLIESGFGVVGTYRDLIAYIERYQEQSGGFGTFLNFGHEGANREATLRSYEIMMRRVAPHFRDLNRRMIPEYKRLLSGGSSNVDQMNTAWDAAKTLYEKERANR